MTDVRQPSGTTVKWQVRPFGQEPGDIEINPLAVPRPVAAANVLAACLHASGRQPGRAELLAWPVSRRLQGLLAVTIATRGGDWSLTATCAARHCGAPMDLPLDLQAFRREAEPAHTTCALPDGRRLEVAVPTGDDQIAWLAAGDAEPGAIVGRLVSRPSDADDVPQPWLAPIEAALEAADPLTTLEIETVCPECGVAVSIPLDLEARCLALLAAEQPRLIDDIHALATAYHWSEAEIIAIPPARRRQYLARINRLWS
jgi:hypothetical protein